MLSFDMLSFMINSKLNWCINSKTKFEGNKPQKKKVSVKYVPSKCE